MMKRSFVPCTIDFLAKKIWADLEMILIDEDRYSLELMPKRMHKMQKNGSRWTTTKTLSEIMQRF